MFFSQVLYLIFHVLCVCTFNSSGYLKDRGNGISFVPASKSYNGTEKTSMEVQSRMEPSTPKLKIKQPPLFVQKVRLSD